ncbi:EamA family transporter RarD [uncultured Rothia sp.]|uniref:EamA family transporter RarD n=1 Tax=uncultured Rothia sp. TaxID=316088 RepID=UPI003217203D
MKQQEIPSPSLAGVWATGYPSIFATHLLWGMLPLYFILTSPANAFEVVAARILFSIVFCSLILCFTHRGWKNLFKAFSNRILMGALVIASLLIGCNWLLYVIATTSGHTLDASLGYFMNPLVSVVLGVLFLGERLRVAQWLAVSLAAAGVTVMSVLYGHVPWIGLGLATSFGLYGLVKNKVGGKVNPLHSFAIELALLSPLALTLMIFFYFSERLTLFSFGAGHFWILAASGIVTAVPLLLFADAASKLPLSVIGMVQYINPTLQFLIAFFLFGERLAPIEWGGYIAIWVACALFTTDAVRTSQLNRKAIREAEVLRLATTASLGIVTAEDLSDQDGERP